MSWTYVCDVESESEPDKRWMIKRADDGRLGCACPSYRFMRGSAKTCKHIRAILGVPAPDARVRVEIQETPTKVRHGGETFTIRRRAMAFGSGPLRA